jgi:N-methylhydantoinase A
MLLGVDVGGTFTDAALIDGSSIYTAKVPSTPSAQADGVMEAIELLLERAGAGAERIEAFSHGMTVATNALLEGTSARTALIATEGFTDIVELARQARPSLYRLCQAQAPPLVAAELRFAAAERMGPAGPLRALEHASALELIAALERCNVESVAVVLLHSYAHPQHELMLGALLAEHLPGVHCSLSHQLVGTFREYERAATTEVDAALSPLLGSYLGRLCKRVQAAGIPEPRVMQSSGGLSDCSHAAAHAALTVLSGPAGGVAAAVMLAELADEPDVLCFDMGGTSCDVCLIEGFRVAETAQREVAGRPLALPMLDIHTVGAGGGSIAWRDAGGALRVGPQSAGARPGPACYGLGGELATVTDANLLLGRLLSDEPLAGDLHLDLEAAELAVGGLACSLGLDLLSCAEGIVRVAEAEMLGALRLMTVERGIDPRSFALMSFGGAGPLHAGALAERLGISKVLCPRASGTLSALGLAAAAPRRDAARTVMLSGESLGGPALARERQAVLEEARAALGAPVLRARLRYELRYRGQSFELGVDEQRGGEPEAAAGEGPWLSAENLRMAFANTHAARYGYRDERADIELVNLRASVWGAAPPLHPRAVDGTTPRLERRTIVIAGKPVEASVIRGEPAPGANIAGPALFALPGATLLVSPGWNASVDLYGTISLCRQAPP